MDDITLTDNLHSEEEEKDDSAPQLFNLNTPVETRLDLFRAQPVQERDELIQKISMMFYLSPIRKIREYIEAIVEKGDFLTLEQRLFLASTLTDRDQSKEIGLNLIDRFLDTAALPSPIRLEYLLLLLKEGYLHREQSIIDFLVGNSTIDMVWRFRSILSLEPRGHLDFMIRLCVEEIKSKDPVKYKLLACQTILSRKDKEIDYSAISFAEQYLIEFTNPDQKNEPNLMGDAADILNWFGTDESKEISKKVLTDLGGGENVTLFANAQNTHNAEIEQGVERAINYLQSTFPISSLIPFQELCNRILLWSGGDTKVQSALERIELDQVTRSNGVTLKATLQYVYAQIKDAEHQDQLEIRLIQELKDMNDTCTTGYFDRLINVLQGFVDIPDLQISISWQDQITAGFTARINARIQSHENAEEIAAQMHSQDHNEKEAFNQFFITTLPLVREEMFQEYQDYLADEKWEEYMKNAIIFYMHAYKMI